MLDISPDEFGRTMVVVQYRKSAIHQSMVEMAHANVEGEDGVDEGEEQLMQHLPQCWSYTLSVMESRSIVDIVRLLDRWEVGLE